MERLKQFLQKLRWIFTGFLMIFFISIIGAERGKFFENSLLHILIECKKNDDYSLLLTNFHCVIFMIVIAIILFYIIVAIPKLFIYEENYDSESGLGRFFNDKEYLYRRNNIKLSWKTIFIILSIMFLFVLTIVFLDPPKGESKLKQDEQEEKIIFMEEDLKNNTAETSVINKKVEDYKEDL